MASSVKKAVLDEYCNRINENGDELAQSAVNTALEALGGVKELVSESLSTELSEMQRQMEGIIAEMERGEENVRLQQERLDECERQLQDIADNLDSFIFDLVRNG